MELSKYKTPTPQRIAPDPSISIKSKRYPFFFGYPLLLLETFVEPERFHGTIYRASNWMLVGSTKGYRHTREGYSERTQSSKLVFLLPLQRNARALLTRFVVPDILLACHLAR